MEFFRGYVQTKNKKSVMKYDGVPDHELLTFDEANEFDEFAGVLADDVILIDVDDAEQSDILMDIVEDLQLDCRVYQTTRGRHFLFKNNGVKSNKTHRPDKWATAVGLDMVDIKLGSSNGLEVLKFGGQMRFIEWDSDNYQTVPKWLTPVNNVPKFNDLNEGDGRNQELFNFILKLQSAGFSKDECRECITLINKYVLKKKLDDRELKTILRDDAFKTEIFFEGKSFLFDKFAHYLKSEYHIVKINEQLHIYNGGVYEHAHKTIEAKMIEKIPTLTAQRRTEVLKYLELIAPSVKVSEANYIAFNNGIYDITTDTLLPYSSDIIITNKIPHDYNPKAYNEVMDKTLDKIACGDKCIRALLEESIGYSFYRRNELGKAFVLTGDGANGKSTFLDLVKHTLGDINISALDLRELGDRFSTCMLFGKLANIGDDIGDEFLHGSTVAIFKKVVTGNRIKAEFKGRDSFDFDPFTKVFVSSNEMPRMRDRTGAVMRRLVMIPFNARFTKDDPDYDPYIKYKLIKEDSLQYLIALAIEGLKRVLHNNEFTKSTKVEKALAEYEEENNPVVAFVNEVGIEDIVNQPTHDVYLRYTVFCSHNQLQSLSKVAFSKQINKRLNLITSSQRLDGKVIRIFVEG